MDRVGDDLPVNDMECRKNKEYAHVPPTFTRRKSSSSSQWGGGESSSTGDCLDTRRIDLTVSQPPTPPTISPMHKTTAIVAQDLTAENFRKHNSMAPVHNNNNNHYGSTQFMHQHLYGGGGSAMGQDKNQVWLRVREQFVKDKALQTKKMDQLPDQMSPYLRAGEHKNVSATDNARLKTLSNSGFSQLLKKTSMGKGVMDKNPIIQGSLIGATKEGFVTNDAFLNPQAHLESGQDGITVREWLKCPSFKRDKMCESWDLFKKIIELVDFAHSKGAALQDLRPSFLKTLPSNRVIYTGSFFKSKSEAPILESLNTKRPLEMSAHCGSSQKQQKLSKDTRLLKRYSNNNMHTNYEGKSIIPELHPRRHFLYQLTASLTTQQQPTCITVQLEDKWYTCPEELNDNVCTFASNIYCLGVLLFELLCFNESWELHSSVMLDLRDRILPSRFLSENPKEAGFCFLLLHPDPSCRPSIREILQHELISGSQELQCVNDSSQLADRDAAEPELLLNFLSSLKDQKQKQEAKLVQVIECLEKDIRDVERRHLLRTSSIFSQACRDPQARKQTLHFEDSTNETKFMRNITHLEDAYFSTRSQIESTEKPGPSRSDKDLLQYRNNRSDVQKKIAEPGVNQKPSDDPLGVFFDGLCKFARYSKFEVCGILRNGDLLNSANVICTLSFDRDEDYIATAGVSKRIKIFEFSSLLNESIDIHYPVVELPNRSKLSCVCWNGYIKNYLASTDYDGIVKMWDVNTGQAVCQFTEHQKRAWSVDFSQADPTMFASGSDDTSVKLWNINEKNSVGTIWNPANVCCVQFSTFSPNLLAFGSADYKVYCYDLRHSRVPWCTLLGHEKAVSYVKFLDSETLVSASTDNSLKLWDLNKTSSSGQSPGACSLTFKGHTNEKNFVGLSVLDGYIACGSETNEIYSYYKSFPMPIASQKFGSMDPISGQETGDDTGLFVSSVCWRKKSSMVVAANSSGETRRKLQLASSALGTTRAQSHSICPVTKCCPLVPPRNSKDGRGEILYEQTNLVSANIVFFRGEVVRAQNLSCEQKTLSIFLDSLSSAGSVTRTQF
ncbi:hypothetical protein ACFE04_026320 [Oxalis oulophora]